MISDLAPSPPTVLGKYLLLDHCLAYFIRIPCIAMPEFNMVSNCCNKSLNLRIIVLVNGCLYPPLFPPETFLTSFVLCFAVYANGGSVRLFLNTRIVSMIV